MMPERYLTTAEVAKIFFGRSPSRVRHWRTEMLPWEVGKSQGGYRWYTLDDVEKITLWLLESSRINGIDAERILEIIKLVREGWER